VKGEGIITNVWLGHIMKGKREIKGAQTLDLNLHKGKKKKRRETKQ